MAEASGGLVRVDRMGQVAVLVLTHPPANLWTQGMAAPMIAALDRIEADASVSAVILRGEGRGFSAGAPLETALTPDPDLARVCARIEACPKPVIAALHGMALGAGCALALAAHWRIAHEGAVIGLPELGLGLIPGAGTTQRLPRLIGAEQALRLMLEARPISAAEALALGLVDEVCTGVLGQAALAMAGRGLAPRRLSQMMPRDLSRLPAVVEAARVQLGATPLPAAWKLVDCVEASGLLPFAMGLNMEEAALGDLIATPEAAGLVHALRAERLALAPPQGQPAPGVRTVGIWGATDVGAELALQAVRAGVEVVLVDADRGALTGTLASVVGALDAEVAAGRLTPEAREAAWGRMAAGQGDLPEGLDLVFVPPGVEGGTSAPEIVLGAASLGVGLTLGEGVGALSELSCGPGARAELVARARAFGQRLGWRVVSVGPGGPVELGLRLALEAAVEALSAAHGAAEVRGAFAAAGLGGGQGGTAAPAILRAGLAALAAEAARMLEDGRAARPCDIDAVAVLSGLMPRWLGGPLHQADRRGLLLLRADLRKLGPAPVFAVSPVIDRLIAEGGRFGL
ncbi:enoyl-CoA hydratase-related protein [Stagnihabitans tardus]|uniref:3-hydroxyacyl-CoA dehydrogenase n=1 Tax=Stagnihabitans tardus TaxID=2699202 RepID=A0AAE5BUI6_9RHOB|nr:enoyl-CoA hydratase-related protein [Stagnihabitans tardus]NBZ86148.1 hypothetical protein [Stagnihabitans tardus]